MGSGKRFVLQNPNALRSGLSVIRTIGSVAARVDDRLDTLQPARRLRGGLQHVHPKSGHAGAAIGDGKLSGKTIFRGERH